MFFSPSYLSKIFWLILACAGLWTLPAMAQEDASRLFFKADYLVRQAEQQRLAGDKASAIQQYQAAAVEFRRLQSEFPGYSPSAVGRNLSAVEGRIRELGGSRRSTQTTQQAPAPRNVTPPPVRAEVVKKPAVEERQVEPPSTVAPSPVRAEVQEDVIAPVADDSDQINPSRSAALAGASAVLSSAPRASLREPLDLIRQATPPARGTSQRGGRPVDITVRTTRPEPEPQPVVEEKQSPEVLPTTPETGNLADRQQAEPAPQAPTPAATVQGEPELVKRIHTLRNAVVDREERIVQLERELDFSKKGRNQQLEDVMADRAELEKEVAQLEAKLASLTEEPTAAADGKEGELLQETRNRLREMSTERVELLRANSSLRDDVESLQEQVAGLEKNLQEKQVAQENTALAAAGGVTSNAEMTLLKQQLEEYKRRMDSAREEKMQNLELIVALKQKLEAADELPGEGAAAEQVAELQEKVNQMGALLSRAKDQLTQLKTQNRELQGQIAASGDAEGDTAAQDQQKALMADLEKAEKRVQELVAENETTQKAREEFQKEAEELKAANAERETRLAELEESLKVTEEKFATVQKEKVALEESLATIENSGNLSKNQLAELQQENDQLKQQLAEVEETAKRNAPVSRTATSLFADEDEPVDEEIAETVTEVIAIAEEALAEADEPRDAPDTGDLADNQLTEPVTQTEVDQAFDLKNPQGLMPPMSAGADPFESSSGAANLGGGPLVSTSAPKPAGLTDDLADLAQEATEHFQSGRLEKAEEMFSEVVTKDPDNVYALSNLGVVRFKMQKFGPAEEVLKKAIEVDPKDAFSFETLGIVYFSQGKIDDAIEVLTMALNQDDTRWTAHNFLGIAASRKGWPEAAEKELRRAIELNPKYSDAHFNLAVLYATGQPPSLALAAKHYKKAMSLGSNRSVELEQLLHRTDLAETGGTP